jgi:LmbE family N-acetylglucosaminyl deacetylase
MTFISRNPVPVVTLVLALIIGAAPARSSSGTALFPRDGRAAIHQRTLDLANPQAVMVVALQPGYEDLKLLAYLRAFQGVRTTVVFLTNGEATPGDTIGQYPVWMTGERKGEAHRVARFLDAGAWFMNLPDVPAPDRPSDLATLWDSTGAQKRLVEVIRVAQPDVLILSPDRRGTGHAMTARDTVALSMLTRAIMTAATARDTSLEKGLLPWRTTRLLTQRPAPRIPAAYTAPHPVMRLTSLDMARQAAALYRTLRLQIGEWNDGALEAHPVTTGRIGMQIVTLAQIAAGIPDPGLHLRAVAKNIRDAITTDQRGVRSAALKPVTAAISATEQLIVYQVKNLDRRERRIAIGWKEGLEDLRCTVRGLKIAVAAKESLLTANQVMFLDVTPDPSSKGKGQTVILFPLAANGGWTVNEKVGYFFNLDSATRFNILTPSEVQYSIPYSEAGLTQLRLDVAFPYVVVHKDPRRELSYMYHREVRVQFGPRRTFALRTPLVYDSPSSPVIAELQNISRDKYAGELVLSDTTGEPSVGVVYFSKKDEKVNDTLFVPGPTPDTTDSRILLLELSGRGGKRPVTTRAFRVAIDSTVKVGLLSTVSGSPVEEALRVCSQPWKRLTGVEEIEGKDPGSVLLVDRGFLADTLGDGALRTKLDTWVRNGGHMIVFPQSGAGAEWLRSMCGATFAGIEPVPPDALVTSPWTGALSTPNVLAAHVWREWVETLAGLAIATARTDARTMMAVRDGSLPLITTVPVGKGMVTLVGADLQSQFMNYHPGAHRILANLIALTHR